MPTHTHRWANGSHRPTLARPTRWPTQVAVLVILAGVAFAASWWRTLEGHRFLPGLLTVVFVPVVIALFVILNHWVGYPSVAWWALAAIAGLHMLFSVPALPYTIYDIAPLHAEPLRLDHVMHLVAGGFVAWLTRLTVLRFYRRPSLLMIISLPIVMAAFLGGAKEVTDAIAVSMAHTGENWTNTTFDLAYNILGAASVSVGLAVRYGEVGRPASADRT